MKLDIYYWKTNIISNKVFTDYENEFGIHEYYDYHGVLLSIVSYNIFSNRLRNHLQEGEIIQYGYEKKKDSVWSYQG